MTDVGSEVISDSTPTADAQATFAATLVDEWILAGVRDAVICPGSRSTPLALALAARAEMKLHVRLDERSAGFYAIGLALGTGFPTIVSTTSGTAAAELHACVLEAHHGRVPLLICTADRPPELHDVGAPQTVEQTKLYGSAPRWFFEPGVAEWSQRDSWRAIAARAVAESMSGGLGPGPVHLNLAFRDPLLGVPGPLPRGTVTAYPYVVGGIDVEESDVLEEVLAWIGVSGGFGELVDRGESDHPNGMADSDGFGRSGGSVDSRESQSSGELVGPGELVMSGIRGLVVVGANGGPPDKVFSLAQRLGWPVLADPRSGCRLDHLETCCAVDLYLRIGDIANDLRPDVILNLGEPWTSKVFNSWQTECARGGSRVVSVDPWCRWSDPDHIVSKVYRSEPDRFLDRTISVIDNFAMKGTRPSTPQTWLKKWHEIESVTQEALGKAISHPSMRRMEAGVETFSEPEIARAILRLLAPNCRLLVSSSMPIRDLECYSPPLQDLIPVFSNRGVNGIDGVCSTAIGLAASGEYPVVAIVGDLAFLHDVSALVKPLSSPNSINCTLVVLDNHGGGIFSFLPQGSFLDQDKFELLFGTSQACDITRVAKGFDLDVVEVSTIDELAAALSRDTSNQGMSVIRACLPSREENVAIHAEILRAVRESLESAGLVSSVS